MNDLSNLFFDLITESLQKHIDCGEITYEEALLVLEDANNTMVNINNNSNEPPTKKSAVKNFVTGVGIAAAGAATSGLVQGAENRIRQKLDERRQDKFVKSDSSSSSANEIKQNIIEYRKRIKEGKKEFLQAKSNEEKNTIMNNIRQYEKHIKIYENQLRKMS